MLWVSGGCQISNTHLRHSVSHGHTCTHTHACTHRHNTKALFSQMGDMLSFAELSRTPILRPFPGVLPQKGWFYRDQNHLAFPEAYRQQHSMNNRTSWYKDPHSQCIVRIKSEIHSHTPSSTVRTQSMLTLYQPKGSLLTLYQPKGSLR